MVLAENAKVVGQDLFKVGDGLGESTHRQV